MAYTRAVYILDITTYLDLLEEFLEPLKCFYPWMANPQPIDEHWAKVTYMSRAYYPEAQRTQKDMLIDWIINEELTQFYYMHIKDHYQNDVFDRIYNQLVVHCGLRTYTRMYLLIPKLQGDSVSYSTDRQCGGLHVHYDLEPRIKPRFLTY